MLAAHLAGLVAVALAVGLGIWQYDAWQARRTAEAVDLTQRDPVPLDDVLTPGEPYPAAKVGQPVEVSGTWVPDATVFVGGREHEGRPGYWVVTPLRVGDAAVPVVRGWVAEPADAPAIAGTEADLVGWLQPPEAGGMLDEDLTDDVFPELRTADIVQRLDGGTIYSAYAVAQVGIGGLPAGDLEQLPPPGMFTALRNLLYALEWWVFAGFAAFIWWRYVRDAQAELVEVHPVASTT
jgi:surfeit locus 1 family protein